MRSEDSGLKTNLPTALNVEIIPPVKNILTYALRIHLPHGNVPVDLQEKINEYFTAELSDIREGKRCERCCNHGDSSDHKGDKKCRSRRFARQNKLAKAPPILIVQVQRGINQINENKKMNLVTSPQTPS